MASEMRLMKQLTGGAAQQAVLVKLHCCVPGTAHVLRVSLQFPTTEVKASPKPSQMEAKGIVLSQRGIR